MAYFSDIHSNLPALEAAVGDANTSRTKGLRKDFTGGNKMRFLP